MCSLMCIRYRMPIIGLRNRRGYDEQLFTMYSNCCHRGGLSRWVNSPCQMELFRLGLFRFL